MDEDGGKGGGLRGEGWRWMIVTVGGRELFERRRREKRGGGEGIQGEESRRRKFTFVMSNSEAGNTIRSGRRAVEGEEGRRKRE